jgi:hypothetical protein
MAPSEVLPSTPSTGRVAMASLRGYRQGGHTLALGVALDVASRTLDRVSRPTTPRATSDVASRSTMPRAPSDRASRSTGLGVALDHASHTLGPLAGLIPRGPGGAPKAEAAVPAARAAPPWRRSSGRCWPASAPPPSSLAP